MITIVTAEQFLYAKIAPLVAAAGSRWQYVQDGVTLPKVFSGSAPQAAEHPFVVLQEQSPSQPLRAVGGTVAWSKPLWLPKVVDKTMTWDSIASMAEAITAELDGASGVAGDGMVWWCEFEQQFSLITNTADPQVQYRSLGPMVRLTIA